jgi:K+-transporting ATPase ATPase C chain
MARPLPAELATASGGGLDPHITEHAALWQAGRVAAARGMPLAAVEQLIRQHAVAPGGLLTPDRLVNVLELNLALDAAR